MNPNLKSSFTTIKLHDPMKQKITSIPSLAFLATLLCSSAQAHVGYTGRDFGSFSGLTYSSVTIANQAITSNYGWADAADGILGDSHKGRAFRFHLDNDASVTIRFEANASATATSVGGLIPAFSIYQGLAAVAPFAASQTGLPSSADHDFSESSVAWRTAWAQFNLGVGYDASATAGSWNALGNWKIGGDGDLPGDFSQLSSFTFKGFGIDSGKTGIATTTAYLSAGDYTLFVGGNDIANKNSPDQGLAYGVKGTVTVNAVPEPETWALMATGAVLLIVQLRGKR
jgi:hypothetical protein